MKLQLQSLLKCKDFVNDNISNQEKRPADQKISKNLPEKDWAFVEEIVDVLKHPFALMKQMQAEHFTLSDFYGAWLRIEMKLEQKVTMESEIDLAQRLKDSMHKYKGQLMLNPLMIAAIYLDPRFTNTLSKVNKLLAVSTLLEIWETRKDQLVKQQATADDSDFEHYIESKAFDACLDDTNNNDCMSDIEMMRGKLVSLEKQPRKPANTDVLKYWQEKKNEEPELFLLSEIIFAIPSSQTTVERAFSTLAYILNPLRGSLSDELLENILLIKCNKQFFIQMIDEELQNM